MMCLGIQFDFKICRLVWHGLGAVARLFPVRDAQRMGIRSAGPETLGGFYANTTISFLNFQGDNDAVCQ
jgi:hypothetical protein